MTLEALLQTPNALPSAPKLVADLIGSFDDDDVSVEDIARKISLDPVLSAKLLRLANSAYYHVSRRIGNVADAVRMLGFVTVRTLVISSGLVASFKTVHGMDLKRFWGYSLHTAVAARWIAKQAGANTDLAFTIGMMHGLGQLVMHAGAPDLAMEVNNMAGIYDDARLEAEKAVFAFGASDVGAALAETWKFPELFPKTIREFPHPAAATPPNRMAAVLHLAAWRARAEENKVGADALAAGVPAAAAAMLGINAADLISAMPPLAELSAGLEELIH